MIRIRLRTIVVISGLLASAPACAHPHVWMTVQGQLVYAPDGTLTGMRNDWTFDDMFSAFATQGLESKKPGEFTRADLEPLAKDNVSSLKEFDYFTIVRANGKRIELKDPTDFYLDYNAKDTVLTLHFTLPLKTPVKARELNIEIYDPDYFVAFSFKDMRDPITLLGAPAGCKMTVTRPKDLKVVPGQQLSEAFFNQLSASANWGAQFAGKIAVKCP